MGGFTRVHARGETAQPGWAWRPSRRDGGPAGEQAAAQPGRPQAAEGSTRDVRLGFPPATGISLPAPTAAQSAMPQEPSPAPAPRTSRSTRKSSS
jgi:hypothetical protein